jgi:hypothetical protein
MTKRTGAPSNYDRGHRAGPVDDPTFWQVFNENTNPLAEPDEPEKWSRARVYFLHCPTLGRVKIGTSVNPKARRYAFSKQLGGEPTVLLGVLNGSYELERLMHQRFAASRVDGEWFSDEIVEEAETLIRADRDFFGIVA